MGCYGRFVPPAFGEVELTPEELEEIRKITVRTDFKERAETERGRGALYVAEANYEVS